MFILMVGVELLPLWVPLSGVTCLHQTCSFCFHRCVVGAMKRCQGSELCTYHLPWSTDAFLSRPLHSVLGLATHVSDLWIFHEEHPPPFCNAFLVPLTAGHLVFKGCSHRALHVNMSSSAGRGRCLVSPPVRRGGRVVRQGLGGMGGLSFVEEDGLLEKLQLFHCIFYLFSIYFQSMFF